MEFLYFLTFNFLGFYAIFKAFNEKLFSLLIFNILIVVTYGLKLVLSCNGHFIVYSSCEKNSGTELLIIFLILAPFFAGQLISVSKQRFYIDLSINQLWIKNYIYPIIYLLILALFTWSGSENFQEMDRSRVAEAGGNGLLNLFIGSFTILLLISIRYENLFYTIIIAMLTFIATGTKQMLFLPLILYFSERFKSKIYKVPVFRIAILFIFILISAQIFRSSDNSEIDYNFILINLAIPFDALDNGVQILSRIYKDNYWSLIIPYDFEYFIESFLNFVPRSIWVSKPEVMGFWRIQRDYLPDLYTSTSGMSVSTSLPVDILLSFGLVGGVIIMYLFGRFVKLVDVGKINIGFAYPLLLAFSVDFSRGGFRNFGFVILQYVMLVIIIYLIKFLCHFYTYLRVSSYSNASNYLSK